MGPNVSTPWGQLPPHRQRWAIPWSENDIDECAVRQPYVEAFEPLARDALQKGCQGLLTLQWRTRDIEEETGYLARFAWNPKLTPDRFYRDLARHAFGPDQEKRMGQHLATLQRLGSRWTGVHGAGECSAMKWTGWAPHFPFELDERVPDYLIPKVEQTIAALAEVPATRESEAAFHLLPQSGQTGPVPTDFNRPGVKEMQAVLQQLQSLRGEKNPARLRAELRVIEETVYALRPRLVAFGMTGRAYCAIDGFLIALHHLQRNAGATEHMSVLRHIRRDLAKLRALYVKAKRIARLERLDYLDATIEFALHFDAAAMLLADGERIDQALAEATQSSAVAAYEELVAAGMSQALTAFTRKLTTRCDWGTLATINVKPMPLYWQTLGKLEALLPAVPPREIQARGQADAVWLSWSPSGRAAGQNLYRRTATDGAWKRVNRELLAADCRMFSDRPSRPGAYEYAVTAVDKDGWESPRSHAVQAVCGPKCPGPRLAGCKPPGRLATSEDLPVRVVAVHDREIAEVTLHYRCVGERTWRQERMVRRFRDSYTSSLPVHGMVEWFVAATDREGHRSVWPALAPRLPWTVVSDG